MIRITLSSALSLARVNCQIEKNISKTVITEIILLKAKALPTGKFTAIVIIRRVFVSNLRFGKAVSSVVH